MAFKGSGWFEGRSIGQAIVVYEYVECSYESLDIFPIDKP